MTFRVTSRMNRPLAASLSAVLGLLPISGCSTTDTYSPGGGMMARDSGTYFSTALNPKTIQLRDTRTGEVLWTYEIPVDRELVIRFYPGRNADNPEMPDEMRWEEWELGRGSGALENKIAVPNERYRRIDMIQRKAEPAPTQATGPSE